MAWDPDHYLRFADHRTRPGLDLLARIPDVHPTRIVDLGAGTGHLTALLAERWPRAAVTGIDSSADMIQRADAEHPGLAWEVADIACWQPDEPLDVIFSNAALHWLDGHEALFARLRSYLQPGGVLAVQMPDNWQAPTHQVPAELLDDGSWPDTVRFSLLRDRLAAPADYRRWLQPSAVEVWRTTYYQQLVGPDPVWDWVTGSVLGPVLATLGDNDRERFAKLCRTRYRVSYPRDPDGVTILPFSRLFLVAMASKP